MKRGMLYQRLAEASDVHRLVLDAIHNNELPTQTTVNSGPGWIDISVTYSFVGFAPAPHTERAVAWAKTAFPGGVDRRGHTNRGSKRQAPTDVREYGVQFGDNYITFKYLAEHEHQRWSGYFDPAKSDLPEWQCVDCRKRITVTQARKLGLMPPLDRSKK